MAIGLLPIIGNIANALRVPALAAFIGQIAANLLGFFAAKMSRAVALNVTIIALIIGLTIGVTTVIWTLGDALSYVSPPWLVDGFSFFVPSNAVPCVTAIYSARVVRWVWTWQFFVITKVS